MPAKLPIKIAMVDDHVVIRNALAALIDNFDNCKVVWQANDGQEVTQKIGQEVLPDVILLDLNMPNMDGHDTAAWMNQHFPAVKILMLTMYDSEALLIRLLQAGVSGFLKKDIHPSELKHAIYTVVESGYYASNHTHGKIANLFRDKKNSLIQKVTFTNEEMQFLKLACTEMTYKEIAIQMKLNPRAVDSLRDHLFEKLDVKSRVGLALYALRKGVVTIY